MSSAPPKHQPNRFSNYWAIHETRLNGFRTSGFVGVDTLEIAYISEASLTLVGQIGCKGRIIIDVAKLMEYADPPDNPDPRIFTKTYAYNVSVQGVGNVFRYDNQHSDKPHSGHADGHHKHVFDWPSNEDAPGFPIWIGADKWPTLSEVIEEAHQWHADNYKRLPDPEGFPAKLRKGFRT